jgi:hypothetical protein
VKTNWREVRDQLYPPETSVPFVPLVPGNENEESSQSSGDFRDKRDKSRFGVFSNTQDIRDKRDESDLETSRSSLEAAGITIAILSSGEMRVVTSEADRLDAAAHRFAVYSPADMYFYIRLDPHDREQMREFKKHYPLSTWEWEER